MNFQGRFIFKRFDEQSIYSKKKDKTYSKLFIICDKLGELGNYETKEIAFTSFGAKVPEFKAIAVESGHEVAITFKIKTNEYNGSYFTELDLLSLNTLGPFRGNDTQAQNPSVNVPVENENSHWSDNGNSSDKSDPFGSDNNVTENKEEDDPFGSNDDDSNDGLPF